MATSDTGPAFAGLLEEMTVEEIRAFAPEVVVLPLGSTEPHGPHLPLGTDTFQVTRLCRLAVEQANSKGARALLYPALPITNNANVRRFPFALRVGIRTLMSMLVDIATQCKEDGIKKVVIVNGHGGNPATIDAATREISGMDDMPFVCWTSGFTPNGFVSPIEHPSEHGGECETSRMMWIRPQLVHEDKLDDNPVAQLRVKALANMNFVRPWHIYVPVSAGGETRKASAQKGKEIIEAEAAALASMLLELSQTPYDESFPYV
jgi:creatinine amidohydrolase